MIAELASKLQIKSIKMEKLFICLSFFALIINQPKITIPSFHKVTTTNSLKESYNKPIKAKIITGAEQTELYAPLLKNKKIALLVNQTSLISSTHLVDSLLHLKLNIVKIFSPEHGFRGNAANGEKVNNELDAKTGLPIISLYGKNKKPTAESLQDVDVVIFDIQDVGARFYTYISTLHYLMDACAENNKELWVLDRPNPNGYYIDGPILEKNFQSFIGLDPLPIVHGLTVGEYAQLLNGEKWLAEGKICKLKVIPCKNYTHKDRYSLPVKPSPNLPNDLAIKLYPSICLFEGTSISVGRGTDFPFQVIGSPDKNNGSFTFTPKTIEGAAKNPPYEDQLCYGIDFRKETVPDGFTLKYVIELYNKAEDKEKFFTAFFDKLAGNDKLKEQIKKGMSESEIKKTWQDELNRYKVIRKKYLLYPDFY